MEIKTIIKSNTISFEINIEDLKPEVLQCLNLTDFKIKKYKKLFPHFESIKVENEVLCVKSKEIPDNDLNVLTVILIRNEMEKAVEMLINLEAGKIALSQFAEKIDLLLKDENTEPDS